MTSVETNETVATDNETETEFTLVAYDELPPAPPRQSKLSDVLERVKNEFPAGKFVLIREFPSATSATGSANHLKLRWGNKPDAYGYTFKTRKVRDDVHGLFVSFDPNKIIDGAAADVDKKYDEFRTKAAEKQAKRAAKLKAEKNQPAEVKTEAKVEEKPVEKPAAKPAATAKK